MEDKDLVERQQERLENKILFDHGFARAIAGEEWESFLSTLAITRDKEFFINEYLKENPIKI